jgi:hypothetical protein
MKFLIDECLSPKLAHLARERGYLESSHVVWEGRGGHQDWNLMPFILDGDWTFVTRNSYDFRGAPGAPGQPGHYQNVEIHAGLICLDAGDMDRDLQLELFGAVLDDLAFDPDLVNVCLEAGFSETDPGEIEIVRYVLPVEPNLVAG